MSGFFKISSAPVVVTITLDKGGIVNSIYECLIVEDTITLDKGGIVQYIYEHLLVEYTITFDKVGIVKSTNECLLVEVYGQMKQPGQEHLRLELSVVQVDRSIKG